MTAIKQHIFIERMGKMTLNQIYHFRAVAKYENYHKAAEALFVSQPSLSRSINALEEELGVKLFEKSGRGIVLTKAGIIFSEHALKVINECEIAGKRMRDLASGSGTIDIGFIFPLAEHYIPHHVRKFLDINGNEKIIFNFSQNHTPAIAEKIRSGDLDVGFGSVIETLDRNNEFEFFPILSSPFIIIVPVDHALAGRREISITELENYPVIGYDKKSGLGSFTKNLYKKLGISPKIAVECPDENSIMAMVSEHFGIALVPDVDTLDEKKICRLSLLDANLVHTNYMFWKKDRYQLPAVKDFIEFMKSENSD